MDGGITKEMYIRTLTEEEYKAVQNKNIKKIREITGVTKSFMIGDTMVAFADKGIKHGLYKFVWKERIVYYIVQDTYGEDRAFCYTVY